MAPTTSAVARFGSIVDVDALGRAGSAAGLAGAAFGAGGGGTTVFLTAGAPLNVRSHA